jgi:hypothetical protein
MRESSRIISYMLSETTTRKRNPALGAVMGLISGALFWAGIILIGWDRSPAAKDDMFGMVAAFLTAFGLVAGAAIGSIAGGVGALAGGLTGRRIIDRLIGGLIGALSSVIAGMIITSSVLRSDLVWPLPQPLLLLSSMLPGILGGVWGARPFTTTRATCAACGDSVRPDAACCTHCGATFDWRRRVETFVPVDDDQ